MKILDKEENKTPYLLLKVLGFLVLLCILWMFFIINQIRIPYFGPFGLILPAIGLVFGIRAIVKIGRKMAK